MQYEQKKKLYLNLHSKYHVQTKQEPQLSQMDRATRHVSKFVLYFMRYAMHGSQKGFNKQK